METITLKLWVSNQHGCDSDMTYSYLEASRWKAPAGVILDTDAQTLSGPPVETWEAYRSLAEAVAANGHGVDCDWADDPCLTACPVDNDNQQQQGRMKMSDYKQCTDESLEAFDRADIALIEMVRDLYGELNANYGIDIFPSLIRGAYLMLYASIPDSSVDLQEKLFAMHTEAILLAQQACLDEMGRQKIEQATRKQRQ